MESLIVSIVVAVASALTFVAYKHPDHVNRVAWVVVLASSGAIIILVAFKEGLEYGVKVAGRGDISSVLGQIKFAKFTIFGLLLYGAAIEHLGKVLPTKRAEDNNPDASD